jgi:branched-chain amino acid transport system ATP-binding protein
MLEVLNLNAFYSNIRVIKNLSFNLRQGEVLCILGRNGAGKTTTLKSIMGLVDKTEGKIILNNENLSKLPAHLVPKKGIGYVPQGRRLFSELTVEENLEIGLMTNKSDRKTKLKVLDMFPKLSERLDQIAGTLSGGEQQMLALARALCIKPSILLLDEPTEGLQPSMISLIRNSVIELKKQGVSIILVEQRIEAILSIADEIIVLENGSKVFSCNRDDIKKDTSKLYKFIGV